ncbi:MAG TPA: gamma-glutamylcyclotransferase family protein [Opitutaceae bacterium]|jgi:gamma-glutamylcyclotransferase (GGCT)/AIG2-like uncharacterized protein YtfP
MSASPRHRVFAYGTLLVPTHQRRLFGRLIAWAPAVLPGWRKLRCVGRYYGIVRRKGAETKGGVLMLTRTQFAIADRWERMPRLYRRRRVRATAAGRALACWVYVPSNPKL